MSVPTYPSSAEAQREEGFVRSKDGTGLYWQRYTPEAPRATVAIFPGGGDHGGRYPAVTRGLVEARFEVALLDFRGHGRSEGRRWHVGAFSEYHDDVDAFLGLVRERSAGRQLFIAAHSMGALIAATWGLLPGRSAAGFVFSSPWLRPAAELPRVKIMLGRLVGKIAPALPMATGLDYAQLTSDEEMQRWTAADPLYGKKTTPRWFTESTAAQEGLLARMDQFRHPMLVLAGGADPIADPSAARVFADQAAATDKAFRLYDGFRHEIWNERERARPVSDAVAWIAARTR